MEGKPAVQKEVFYSPASDQLIDFRQKITAITFERSRERLAKMKDIIEDEKLSIADRQRVYDLYQHNKELTLNLSQFGDDRPLTSIRYSHDGAYLVSGSFGNTVKVWDGSTLSCQGVLVGHSDRITSVANCGPALASSHRYLMASTSADGSCCLWDGSALIDESNGMETDDAARENPSNLPKHCLHRITGVQSIISAVDFHPFYPVLATACHDFSWRLLDVQTGQQLLLQDGHVRECSALAFHPDGSLIYTADAGGVGLLWDLRSGQMIQGFQGHGKKISEVTCHPNGFQVATSSLDNTVKIWDLRKRKCSYTLPAHPALVSGVRYSPSGEVLLTSSFDGTLKLWSSRNYQILRTLAGHEGKVMACDFAPDEQHVASAGYDRTIKLWAHKDEF